MVFVEEQKYAKEIGIYQIKNLLNNKVYIGQTGQNFQKRFWHHQWKLRKNSHDNKYLQAAWNKYGEENFEFSVVEIVPQKELNNREVYWISFYREKGLCYSIQDGGQDISELHKNITPEQRKAVGEKNREHLLGSHATEETKKKMSETRKGKFVKKKTQVLNPELAKQVKEMLVNGSTPKEIMIKLDVSYKPINGIISRNTWAHVIVDGWDEFQANRPRGKGNASVGRKNKPVKKINKHHVNPVPSLF